MAGFASADELGITNVRALIAMPLGKSGAAYMEINNRSEREDRLIGASSDIAARVELHAHHADHSGIVRMHHVKDGLPLPEGTTSVLAHGGHHIMMIGLTKTLSVGDEFTMTLYFEHAEPIEITVPVELPR